jgi:hypothetical protein
VKKCEREKPNKKRENKMDDRDREGERGAVQKMNGVV